MFRLRMAIIPLAMMLTSACLPSVTTPPPATGTASTLVTWESQAKLRLRDAYLGYDFLLTATDLWAASGRMTPAQAQAAKTRLQQVSKLLEFADAAVTSGRIADFETAKTAIETLLRQGRAAIPAARQ